MCVFTGGWVAVVNPIFVDVLGSRSIPLQARIDTKNSFDLFIDLNSEKHSAIGFLCSRKLNILHKNPTS
jgi:hypothetical protein